MSDPTMSIIPLAIFPDGQKDGLGTTSSSVVIGNSLGAYNDQEAVLIWLNTHAKNPHTRKAYLQEVRRFAAFMVHVRGTILAGATVADLEAFRSWLSSPSRPDQGWPTAFVPFRVGADGRWQGLSLGSRRRADTTIRGLYGFLHAGGYLRANPFLQLGKLTGEEISLDELARRGLTAREYARQLRQQAIRDDNLGQDKAFSFELWRWLRGFLDAPENTWQIAGKSTEDEEEPADRKVEPWSAERRARLRCILLFGYAAASRRSELSEAMMNAIVRSGTRWVWKVVGKGRNAADGPDRVTLDEDAMNALQQYRLTRGLGAWPDPGEFEVPVIAKLTPRRRRRTELKTGANVTAGYLNLELRRFFDFAAVFAARVNPGWALSLRQAASHWLRHTRGSHFALGHVSLARTAEQLRHKDPRTTSRYYVHMKDEERGEAVDAISQLLK
ncbi:site-specific integrase [Zoogloea sp. LCSB751]|uniref:tyrosine-type recombinase/integrase n=1 Tax=Zoogloea sp. LCSB751 TaxID=1965277 RepID=UPI001116A40D|nr:site-specific integrase [Zoogloea sp. LCSB751]